MKPFKIADGRMSFFQWDKDRKIILDKKLADCKEVHFTNELLNNAFVVLVKEENGVRYCDVPNILLQNPCNITVYAYIDATITYEIFTVVERPKPDDYVYTDTEVLTWEQLDERLDVLEAAQANVPLTNEEIEAILRS